MWRVCDGDLYLENRGLSYGIFSSSMEMIIILLDLMLHDVAVGVQSRSFFSLCLYVLLYG